MGVENLVDMEAATSIKRINYDTAEIIPGFVNDTWFLVVSGEAPCLNMKVELAPNIYISCPDYWNIEVVGSLPGGFCLTTMKPYTTTIPLAGIAGSKGIRVVGANKREEFDVSGGCTGGTSQI